MMAILNEEQKKVDTILADFLEEPATESLKKKIHEVLTTAKAKGIIQVPFQVVLRKDISRQGRDQVEVILETKV